MKLPFCFIRLHLWKYKKEKHKVENHPANREHIRVIVRQCKWCGERECHPLPRVNQKLNNWEKCNFTETETLTLK